MCLNCQWHLKIWNTGETKSTDGNVKHIWYTFCKQSCMITYGKSVTLVIYQCFSEKMLFFYRKISNIQYFRYKKTPKRHSKLS